MPIQSPYLLVNESKKNRKIKNMYLYIYFETENQFSINEQGSAPGAVT